MTAHIRPDLDAEAVHARHVLNVVPIDAVAAGAVVAETAGEELTALRTEHLGAALVMLTPQNALFFVLCSTSTNMSTCQVTSLSLIFPFSMSTEMLY